jgi:tetratricopeptide (TPR) repeat protein
LRTHENLLSGCCSALLAQVFFCLMASLAFGAPRAMLVTVVNKHFTPPQPVAGVRVTLGFFDGSQTITDARDRTNRDGQTHLLVSEDAVERGELHIEVEDAEGLVIYQPSEGLLRAIPATLEVALLPKGSPALLDPPQVEAMLSRLSVRNQQLHMALSKVENQKPDFDGALRQWAASNGFAFEEVDQKVRAWAEDILAHKQAASLEQQAEAELGLRHFEQAGALFQAAANVSEEALDNDEEKYLTKLRTDLRDFVQKKTQAAQAFEFAEQYHLATETADGSSHKAAAQHEHFPKDEVIRQIWLTAAMSAEEMRFQEGSSGVKQDSIQQLQMVIEHAKTLVAETDQPGNELHVRALACTASALSFLAGRANDRDSVAELEKQSVEAFRAASRATDKNRNPRMWQIVQLQLDAALISQSLVSAKTNGTKSDFSPDETIAEMKPVIEALAISGDRELGVAAAIELGAVLKLKALSGDESQRAAIYAQLVTAYRTAVGLVPREQFPGMWATCAENLGTALADLAAVKSGDESIQLYGEAVKLLRDLQQTGQKDGNTTRWLMTSDALSSTLSGYAQHTMGEQSEKLFDQAIEVKREELKVLSKAEFPQEWAQTESDMGEKLSLEAARIVGDKCVALLNDAAAAHRAALEVYTKTATPIQWAISEEDLGNDLEMLARKARPEQAPPLLNDAIAAIQASLSVYRKDLNPDNWAHAQALLGEGFLTFGDLEQGDARAAYLQRALEASTPALEVFTKNHHSDMRSAVEFDIGRAYYAQGLAVQGLQAHALMGKAATAWEAAREDNVRNVDPVSALAVLYHDILIEFAKAYEAAKRALELNPTPENQLNVAEASLTYSRFDECVDKLNSVPEASMDEKLRPGRRILLLACQAGGRKGQTVATAEALSEYSKGIEKSGWSTGGDRKYLSEASEFAEGRALWIRLFQAFEDGDGPAVAASARELTTILRP